MPSCPLCAKELKSQATLKIHMARHTKEKPYKCPTCPAAFGLMDRLKKHIKTIHDGVKTMRKKNTQCPMCAYKCCDKADLEVHMRKHTAERPFSCKIPGCGLQAKSEKTLRAHVRQVHSDERPYECPTDGCNYKAKRRQGLTLHFKIHNSEKPFVCQVPGCDHRCKSKSNLKRHTFLVHTDEKPFKCSTCDFRTNNTKNLKLHQGTHGNIKKIKCLDPNCSYASFDKQRVKRHFDAKHRRKDIRCTQPGCNRKYGSITSLNIHLRQHERPIVKCPSHSCKFSTRYKSYLHEHVARFHEDLDSASLWEPREFNLQDPKTDSVVETLHCRFPNCGYQTEFPNRYDRHRLTHNEEEKRKHVCTFCFCRFTTTRYLNIHIQGHLREKPYSCSQCTYTAVTSSKLRSHAENVHNIHTVPFDNKNDGRKCLTCKAYCTGYSELVLHSMSHLRPVVVLNRLHVNTL